MEKKEETVFRKHSYAIFLTVILLLFFFGNLMEVTGYHLNLFEGAYSREEILWDFGELGGPSEKTTLSQQRWLEPGKTYVLSTELTYNGNGDNYPCAFVTSGNFEMEAFLDGKPMFHYTKEDRGFPSVQSMGGAAFTVPLGENCAGRTLRLELRNPMKYPIFYRLPGVVFGDYASILQNLLMTYSPGILISAAILFTVLVLVLMGNCNDGTQWTYLHFSVFAYLIVLYRGMQDLYFLYTWASPLMAFLCEFFSMVACPIPILLAYRNELKPRFTKTFNFSITFLFLSLFLQLTLHFTGAVDVLQFLPFTHGCLLASAGLMLFIMLRTKQQGLSLYPFKKLIPILVGAVLDLLTFYIRANSIGAGSFFAIGNYIGIGLLISLIMMVLDARREREKAYRETKRNQVLEIMAYKDSLTGVFNRAAFTREIARIQAQQPESGEVLVVAADLNGLKLTNDTMGHGAGDRLIQRTADLLVGSFGKRGQVFRTGGDEFFVILYHVDLNDWRDLKIDFDKQLEHSNSLETMPLSVAMGHAFLQSEGIEYCIQTADRRMYQNKSTFPGHGEYKERVRTRSV